MDNKVAMVGVVANLMSREIQVRKTPHDVERPMIICQRVWQRLPTE